MKRTLEISEIIKLYLDGASTSEIAKLANISQRYVRLILANNHIEKRPFGSWRRKYTVNEHYFKTWSDKMAYILGFFVADGFIEKDFQMISFAQKEKYILEEIRNELASNHPIQRNKNTGVYMLNINSKIMRQDLMELHEIFPKKSNNVKFPYVPDEYLHHFIRGYFDGDGCIDYRSYTVSFVGGSLKFMLTLKEILEKEGFSPYLRSNSKHYRIIISGRKITRLFSKWIYKDKNLYLTRKYNSFEQESLRIEDIHEAKHKTNKAAVILRKNIFIEKYKDYHCIKQACNETGITVNTFQNWLVRDKDFNNKFQTIKNNENEFKDMF